MTEDEKQDLIEYFKNASPNVTALSDRDRDIFLAMLDADDEPNEKLIEAFKIHDDLIKEEKELVAAGLMRLPKEEKDDEFLNMPAPQVERSVIQKVIREERNEE